MSAGPTAQPSRTPGNSVFDVVPVWTTTIGREAPQARQRLVERSRARDRRRPRRSGSRNGAASSTSCVRRSARETDPGRVLVVGDRVEQLRPQARSEPPLEVLDVEPVLVQRNGDEVRLVAAERLDRAEVRRAFDDDDVARIDERLGDQLERLDRAARDQQLVLGRAPALQRLEPTRERVAADRRGRGSARTGTPSTRRTRRTPGTTSTTRSRGNVTGSGKPPANEIRPGTPRRPSTVAIPSSASPRARAASSASQRPRSGVTAKPSS